MLLCLSVVRVKAVCLCVHFWPKYPELEGAGREEAACRQVCGITAVSFKWCMKWKIPVWCTGRAEPLMSVKSLLQRLFQRLTGCFGLGGTSKIISFHPLPWEHLPLDQVVQVFLIVFQKCQLLIFLYNSSAFERQKSFTATKFIRKNFQDGASINILRQFSRLVWVSEPEQHYCTECHVGVRVLARMLWTVLKWEL